MLYSAFNLKKPPFTYYNELLFKALEAFAN